MMDNIIKIDRLSFSYNAGKTNETKALNDCNLSVIQGDFVGITGESGSGKTTLLNILGGILTASEGTYLFDGTDMLRCNDNKRTEIRNGKIGFVLQSYGLLDDRNALENVCVPLLFSKCPWGQIEKKASEAMDKMGILSLAKKRPSQLSGGQNQRIAIARALVNSPRLILADEPTGALDSKNTHLLMELLKKINEEGTTVVLVTHNTEILSYCHRLFVMKDGKIEEGQNEKV